jgi:putative peptide zinc metalloprotease protein
LGALLVTRVAGVAVSHPATSQESRLAASGLAAVRGVRAPAVAPGEEAVREQLIGYARLTGAFDRHATVLAAGRELAVVATGVLVATLLALVVTRKVRPAAGMLTLAATCAMGPAVAVLATVGPGLVGTAWAAAGTAVLACAARRAVAVLGVLAIAAGVVTEPLVALPLVVGIGLLLGARERAAGRDLAEAGPRRRLLVSTGPRDPVPWLMALVVLPAGGLVGTVARGSAEYPLPGPDRTVLLLLAAVVLGCGCLLARLRIVAAASAAALAAAAVPWSGAASALPVVLVCSALLAALLLDASTRGSSAERPHPLVRVSLSLPVVVLVLTGTLFLPSAAPGLPHGALARWLTGPDSPSGDVAVPEVLWGDLVRDGVPAGRLAPTGTPAAGSAAWAVTVGVPPGSAPAARFGSGSGALTVLPAHP